MTAILSALAPIFLLILAGNGIQRARLLGDSFWVPAEGITYYLLFPALLLHRTATAPLDGLGLAAVFTAFLGGVVAISILLMVSKPRLGVDGPGFTSVLQGSIRPNVYVGLAAAGELFGEVGLTLAAVAIAGLTPLVNIVSVTALARYGSGRAGTNAARIVRTILTNPIILSVGGGISLNLAGLALPPIIEPLAEILGGAALPLALLAVGAGLSFRAFLSMGRTVFVPTVCKFLFLPGAVWLICRLMGADHLAMTVAVLFAALPSSTSGYIMARQLGGDHALLANLITIQTLFAAITLPLTLILIG